SPANESALLLSFLSPIPPPPGSPLFPYTTLFRSHVVPHALGGDGLRLPGHGGDERVGLVDLPPPDEHGEEVEGRGEVVDFFSVLDRKSTRLNSSHVSISYAVFCLKKKKTANGQRG